MAREGRISEDVGKVRMYTGPALMYSVQTITLFLADGVFHILAQSID